MASDQDLARQLIVRQLIQESHWQYWLQCREQGDQRSFAVFLTEQGYLHAEALTQVHYQLSKTLPASAEDSTQFVNPITSELQVSEEGDPVAIGSYRVTKILGKGGFGKVYEGEAKDGQKVALKILLDPTVESLPRFQREQRLLSLFGFEEGFVPLLETGLFSGGPFFAMPLMTGGSLKDRVRREEMTVEEASELMLTLGRAVARAHREGVVHRDLKPDNVLFDSENRAYISDLGLAKHFSSEGKGADQSVSLSVAGEGYGTPGYMPPEQMKNAKEVGPEADVFALGSLFFYCLARRIPYEGMSAIEIAANVLKGERRSLKRLRGDCPLELCEFIDRCLAVDPRNRWRDAEEFVEELELLGAPEGASHAPLIASIVGALVLVISVFLGLQLWISSKALPPKEETARTDKRQDEKAPERKKKEESSKPVKLFTPPRRDLDEGFRKAGKKCQLKRIFGQRDARHAVMVSCCDISPDGRFGVSGGLLGLVKVFDIETGKTLWEKKMDRVDAISFSPDSRQVFVGTEQTLKVWDWVDDAERYSLKVHTERILSIVVSPDGQYCATGSGRETYLFQIKNWLKLPQKAPYGGRVTRFSGQQSLMIAGADRVVLWDYKKNEISFEASYERRLNGFSGAISRDAQRIIVGHQEMQMSCWTLGDDQLKWRVTALRPPPKHYGQIRSVLLSKDEKRVISGGGDNQIHVWDLKSGELLKSLRGHVSWVHAMALHPDGQRLLSVSNDQSVRLWNLETGQALWKTVGHQSKVLDLSISRDGKKLLSASLDATARVWDLESGLVETVLNDHRAGVYQAKWSLDRNFIATAGVQRGLIVHDLVKQRKVIPKIGRNQVNHLFFGKNYLYVSAKSGQVLRITPGQNQAEAVPIRLKTASTMTESPGGKYLAIGGMRGELCMKQISTVDASKFSRNSRAIRAHGRPVTNLIFFKDNRRLLSGSGDGLLKLWDVEGARAEESLRAHPKGVHRLALSANERFVISLGFGGLVHVWDLKTRKLGDQIDLSPLGYLPLSLCVAPDKPVFYLGLSSGIILEYQLP